MAAVSSAIPGAKPAPAESVNVWGLLGALGRAGRGARAADAAGLPLCRADHARPAAVFGHPVDDRGGRLRDQRGADRRA